ncbi:uncharacterized protein LOC130048706 [Ostrea edulis]|uniref:uncharacterized protein LOC130048706 n=1 Tax=Ostrea edulis TaxID=37623 RepID=UPI0024AF3B3F|nr:uncharacterized protein LOC130048706 [Ostrea edulis]
MLLTPVLAKLLDSYPVQHLRKVCPRIDTSKCGAIQGSSATHALLKILQPIYKELDDSKYFAILLLVDFSKAFDHIHHGKLLEKLQNSNADPVMIQWFQSFVTNHVQRVKIGNEKSDWATVNGGVPQGTISRPDLIIHMVADPQTDIPNVKFVDKTTFFEILRKSENSQMTSSIKSIMEWSAVNQLGINATKTKEIIVSFAKDPEVENLSMNGTEIE